MAKVPTFKLNDGYTMPSVGMGCWQGQPGPGNSEEMVKALLKAFEVGYRSFDTAAMYQNEQEVGRAVRESGVPREEIFVTTKLNNTDHDNVAGAFETSLKLLDIDYVDLYLMHWPQGWRRSEYAAYGLEEQKDIGPTFNQVWAEMEKLLETHKGKIRSIGVSNFSPRNLNTLLKTAKVVPAINQVEVHPYLPQEELVEYCNEHNILITAYSPLGAGAESPILTDSLISEIANQHKVTAGQVALSWLVQRGICVIPKSANEKRMKDNITLIQLSEDEMDKINNLHRSDPKKHTRLCGASSIKNGKDTVLGWTLDQLGWDVGFDFNGAYLQPASKDPAKTSGKGVPGPVADFVKQFYQVSDTPEIHEKYAESFINDQDRMRFQIGPMEPTNTRQGIVAWRQKGWEGVTRRKHVVNGIFLSPEWENEIMLDGTVEMDKNGTTLKFNWAGRMVFDQTTLDEGHPLIESYKVWLSQA